MKTIPIPKKKTFPAKVQSDPFKMPKKAKKTPKIAVLSDSDEDDFKKPKKKGHKIALSDTDDEDDFLTASSEASRS